MLPEGEEAVMPPDLSTALLEGKEGCSHFADEGEELQEGRGLQLHDGRRALDTGPEPGLPAQCSHRSRQLQETAGLCNEKRGTGKLSLGFLGKKATDLPQ